MGKNQEKVTLFRNGRNQVVKIPSGFEIDSDEVILRREGNRLILEPVVKKELLSTLDTLEPLESDFPEVKNSFFPLYDIRL